jgi:hypothetical protein
VAFWRQIEVMMDDLVDDYWAEPVRIVPWGPVGIDDDGQPDPARKVVNTRGILVMPGAAATGEAGTQATGMTSGQIDIGTWLSITDYNLKSLKLSDIEQGDRVYFEERDEWYMIDHPIPSKTGRPQIYMSRIQENTLQQG